PEEVATQGEQGPAQTQGGTGPMNGVERFDDSVWDRFFDFLYGEGPSAQEAQERLRLLGIDVTPAVRKVQDALQASRARARFEAAREQLRELLKRRFTGTALAAHGRKVAPR